MELKTYKSIEYGTHVTIFSCGGAKIAIYTYNKTLASATENNGYDISWHENGNVSCISLVEADLFVGLYQTWEEDGKREEVSNSAASVDVGEHIRFNSNRMMVRFFTNYADEESDLITNEVSKLFKNPLKPTKEEQLQVRLTYGIPLIPVNIPELRDINGGVVYVG